MIESQIAQLATAVPLTDKGKILGQSEDPETTNLVDFHNAGFYRETSSGGWEDYSLPVKKGDPGKHVIPIAIAHHVFQEAVCDFGASVNIKQKVIYEKIHGDPLLYTNMHLQLVDQSLCYLKGILEDICV